MLSEKRSYTCVFDMARRDITDALNIVRYLENNLQFQETSTIFDET